MDENSDLEAERTFLHDISNQLVIILGMGGIIDSKLENDRTLDDKSVERLKKLLKASDKIKTLIRDRRDIVKNKK